jgi:hypothetical protein
MSTHERDEFPPHELERLYAIYNGRDAGGGPAGIGVQARDKLIRRLIEQLRRERSMPKEEREALERSVIGALRSAIHDHGPITAGTIGSAAKRVVGNLRNRA